MKFLKNIIYILFATILLSGFTACRKMSHNGKLDAQWQVMTVENIETGEVTDISTLKRYICINLHVVNLTMTNGASVSGNVNYDDEEGIVNMDFPYSNQAQIDSYLSYYGILTNPVTFEIINLDSKELKMRSSKTIVTCRRF